MANVSNKKISKFIFFFSLIYHNTIINGETFLMFSLMNKMLRRKMEQKGSLRHFSLKHYIIKNMLVWSCWRAFRQNVKETESCFSCMCIIPWYVLSQCLNFLCTHKISDEMEHLMILFEMCLKTQNTASEEACFTESHPYRCL